MNKVIFKQYGMKVDLLNDIPYQYSKEIECQFVKEDAYSEYQVYAVYLAEGDTEQKLIEIDVNGNFKLKLDFFKELNEITIGFTLGYGDHVITLKPVKVIIELGLDALNKSILPEDETTWKDLVDAEMKIYTDQVKDSLAQMNQNTVDNEANKAAIEKINVELETKANKTDVTTEIKGRTAVITGEFPFTATTSSLSVDIAYPEGFTPENCVVVNAKVGWDNTDNQMIDYYAAGSWYVSVKECKLPSNKLILSIGFITTSGTFTKTKPYKVVLMRID